MQVQWNALGPNRTVTLRVALRSSVAKAVVGLGQSSCFCDNTCAHQPNPHWLPARHPDAVADSHNDGSGAPTLTEMGASFSIATGGELALFIAALPNGSSVWVRVVDEVSGAVLEQEIAADLPANTQFLSPRLFMNNGATAAAVACDSSGVYVETEY
jgi:hypothetical protein